MTVTTRPAPTRDEAGRLRALTARVNVGRLFAAVPSEFVMIAAGALILTGFGLVMVLSATSADATAEGATPYGPLIKQSIFAAVGIPIMLIASRMPVRLWRRLAWPLLLVAVAGQLLVFTPLGMSDAGNTNWIRIGSLQAQPSEFLKLALALWLAAVLARKQTLLRLWRHVLIPVIPVSVAVIATVVAGHDLGTAMVLVLIVLAALFFAGVRLRLFILPMLAGAGIVALLAVTSENRMRRIMSFLDPDCLADYYNTCYQPLHGIFGLASGGVLGLGLGNSKQKYEWLPAAANDYIFAIVGEELGLIGCCVVLALFALFALGAFRVIRRTQDAFVRVAAGAITIWIVGQSLLNIGVVLRLFPVLGVPLPFMSQGGTSLLSVLAACGVLLSFARALPPRQTIEPAR